MGTRTQQGQSLASEEQWSWEKSGTISKKNVLLIPLDLGKRENGMEMERNQLEMGETLGISKENTIPLTPLDLWTLESGKTGWGEVGAERSLGNSTENVLLLIQRGLKKEQGV